MTWTTLSLTIHADGTVEPRLVGATSFPRHWVYDHSGRLVAKTGFIDHETWWREAFGTHTPWGVEDSAPIVTAVESALERQLSVAIIDAKPQFRRLKAGRTLVQQGDPWRGVVRPVRWNAAGRDRRQPGGRGRSGRDPGRDGAAA